MKKFPLTMICACIIVFPLFGQGPLQMKVTLPKNIYLLDEPVEIGLSIINAGNIIQKGLGLGTVIIKLLDNTGRSISNTGPTGDWFSPNKNELQPGEENYYIISIVNHFGQDRPLFSNRFIPVGNYTIKVYLKPQNKIIDSTEITFQIAEPRGDELLAHDEYVNAISITKEYHERAIKLEQLADTHPNSTYLPLILVNLYLTYEFLLKDETKANAAIGELLEKCTGTYNAYLYLPTRKKAPAKKEEYLEFLKRQKEKNKNTIIEKKINELIQEESEK